MLRKNALIAVGCFLFLTGLALSLSSCGTLQKTANLPPHVEGAHFVGNKSCTDCHAHIAQQFPSSPHGQFHREDAPLSQAMNTGCESCHGPGSLHVQTGGGKGKSILNPGKDPSLCLNCHLQTQAQFNLAHHHPVMEEKMNCVQCHDPHGHDIYKPQGGLAMARLNEGCAQCHKAQARPVAFEHEAMREGCTTCHQPHGSVNPKMLTERDNNLCLKCHAQVQLAPNQLVIGKIDHTEFIRRASCWAAGCHSAVHGSNISPHLHY